MIMVQSFLLLIASAVFLILLVCSIASVLNSSKPILSIIYSDKSEKDPIDRLDDTIEFIETFSQHDKGDGMINAREILNMLKGN